MSPTSHFDRSSIDTSGNAANVVSHAARACSTVTSGFSLPTTGTSNEFPGVILISFGVHAVIAPGKSKPGGMTPTTVWLMSLSLMTFPTIFGSEPKRDRHS